MTVKSDNRIDRQARRREKTRARLVNAAKTLFARQGVERTRINEITEEADVGFGSFYNYFENKDAIIAAVLRETAEAHAEEIAALTSGENDPAAVIAIAHRHFVRLARRDPEWAWLVIRMEGSQGAVLSALHAFAKRDLEKAVAAGRLSVPDVDVALAAAGGAFLGVLRAVLKNMVGDDADVHHAAGVLRMLGLPAKEAAEIAARPLPASPADDGAAVEGR